MGYGYSDPNNLVARLPPFFGAGGFIPADARGMNPQQLANYLAIVTGISAATLLAWFQNPTVPPWGPPT